MVHKIREAHFSEQAQIGRVCAAAFWDDELFGDLIHPHRKEFPADNNLYWLRRCQVNWWDYTHRFMVSTTMSPEGREIVTGVAQWARLGKGGKSMECWWFNPRTCCLLRQQPLRQQSTLHYEKKKNSADSPTTEHLAKPLAALFTSIAARIWPNRAAEAANEDIIERAYPYFNHVWSGPRAESWYLETLAVHPDYQRQGNGRALVKWGLDQAEQERVCASVVSARGKERFYERCGFDTKVGTASMGEGNPLAAVPGAPILFRDVKVEP